MQYQYFKVFFKDSQGRKHAVDIENDYEYSYTSDFVERVVRQLNEQFELNIPTCASNYRLYFAKKNGQRNSNYPEIDMHNTNIQTAMKFHDKNLFRLKVKSNSSRNSFVKENSMAISQSGDNDIQLSQGKLLQSSKGKNLDRSVLTNITNNTTNDKIEQYDNKKIPTKGSINQGSDQTGFFSCFRFC